MLHAAEPLHAHRAFLASDAAELDAMLQASNASRVMRVDRSDRPLEVVGNHCFLPQGELWFSRSNTRVVVNYPDDDILRMRFWHGGSGALCNGRSIRVVTARQATISTAAAQVDFDAGFEQICWRGSKEIITQKIVALTGRPLNGPLDFEASLDLDAPATGTLTSILGCILRMVDGAGGLLPRTVLAEMEQAFIVSFLSTNAVHGLGLLGSTAPQVAPWQVRRAEAHIEANWHKPITIEDLVEVTGTSARSLFRTFKDSRGCSPLEFARRLRLDHARHMLEHPQASTTVTQVAQACGFGDLGRFAKEFQRAFGQRPSELLARRRDFLAVA
jgi:AraC-like DNA-binding protein